MNPDALVFDAIRTPRGRGKATGSLHEVTPVHLVAGLIDELLRRNPSLDPALIDDIVLGTVAPVNDQGGVVAKTAAMVAGLPDTVAGLQLNRYCASGLEAVNTAAQRVRSGWEHLILAGGVESMSRVPMGSEGNPWADDPEISAATMFVPQGIGADLLATVDGYTRADVDAYAASSQARAAQAQAGGYFERSVVPVIGPDGRVLLDRDEFIRPGTSVETLAGLKPSFADVGANRYDEVALRKYPDVGAIDHVHTAGNSSGIVDGAALVAIGSPEIGATLGLTPRGRIVATAVSGADPTIMLTGPAPAVRKALRLAGMSIDQIDLVEINEAFASVVLRFMNEFGLPRDKVNVNGGAIALGHPLGATGAMIVGTVLDELDRRDQRFGLCTLCVGGGMGIATIIERL